jgi:subtilisin family serine protease
MRDQGPAWSGAFDPTALETLPPVLPLEAITPEWAWGGGTGRGVKVAVIDSGVEASHPDISHVEGYVSFRDGPEGMVAVREEHDDSYGHGTACAGIIRALAPECELYSVKVLGADNNGRGPIFLAGLAWAIENGMHICNLSLGSTKKEYFGILHELVDQAYFRNVILVAAANNMPVPSYPSLYSSVISVACHAGQDPEVFYCNPRPPVEFGAVGIDVRVPWREGYWMTVTGNSFAAAHMTGIVVRILGKHPALTPFQMKTVLRALSANVQR